MTQTHVPAIFSDLFMSTLCLLEFLLTVRNTTSRMFFFSCRSCRISHSPAAMLHASGPQLHHMQTGISHHWTGLLCRRPAPSSCPARAPAPPAACEGGWSPRHPAVQGHTQMFSQHIVTIDRSTSGPGVAGRQILPVAGSGCSRGRPPAPEGVKGGE